VWARNYSAESSLEDDVMEGYCVKIFRKLYMKSTGHKMCNSSKHKLMCVLTHTIIYFSLIREEPTNAKTVVIWMVELLDFFIIFVLFLASNSQ
jgi:hypothetical protein